jgi:hypothetical protein
VELLYKSYKILVRFGDIVYKRGKMYVVVYATWDILPNKRGLSKTVFLDVVELRFNGSNNQKKSWKIIVPVKKGVSPVETCPLFDFDRMTYVEQADHPSIWKVVTAWLTACPAFRTMRVDAHACGPI